MVNLQRLKLAPGSSNRYRKITIRKPKKTNLRGYKSKTPGKSWFAQLYNPKAWENAKYAARIAYKYRAPIGYGARHAATAFNHYRINYNRNPMLRNEL